MRDYHRCASLTVYPPLSRNNDLSLQQVNDGHICTLISKSGETNRISQVYSKEVKMSDISHLFSVENVVGAASLIAVQNL